MKTKILASVRLTLLRQEKAAALFLKRTCGTRTAAVFLRNVGWPLDWALRVLR